MGLSATQNLSLPMMVLLQHASILMTMLLEKWMQNDRTSPIVHFYVGLKLAEIENKRVALEFAVEHCGRVGTSFAHASRSGTNAMV